MTTDIFPQQTFRKIQWGIVSLAVCVIAGIFFYRFFYRTPSVGVPIKLSITDGEKVLIGSRFIIGDSSARFCVVEFFDYECPPCRHLSPEIYKEVLAMQGKASLSLHNFPLDMHPHARSLALIATMLDDKEFLDFHSHAFSLTGQELEAYSKDWRIKLDHKRPSWKIEAEQKLAVENMAATQLMVDATPSIFVFDRHTKSTYKCQNLEALKVSLNVQ